MSRRKSTAAEKGPPRSLVSSSWGYHGKYQKPTLSKFMWLLSDDPMPTIEVYHFQVREELLHKLLGVIRQVMAPCCPDDQGWLLKPVFPRVSIREIP